MASVKYQKLNSQLLQTFSKSRNKATQIKKRNKKIYIYFRLHSSFPSSDPFVFPSLSFFKCQICYEILNRFESINVIKTIITH